LSRYGCLNALEDHADLTLLRRIKWLLLKGQLGDLSVVLDRRGALADRPEPPLSGLYAVWAEYLRTQRQDSMTQSQKMVCSGVLALLGLVGCQHPSLSSSRPTPQQTRVGPEPDAVQAQAVIAPFAQQLLATVQQALQVGGPTAAIAACQSLAPGLTAQAGQQGWTVKRTSLKLRNPANAPDAWEKKVLEQFEREFRAGTPLSALRRGEQVQGEYRYLQAIAVQAPCTTCHGVQLSAPVQAQLQRLYPQDQATGYQVGDLRGAFSVRKPL
jgi:hypothetical protein